MLPSNLLTVWKRKGVIWPRYAKASNDNLEVANSLIETYKRSIGEKKRVLKEFVGELEDSGYDYHFVRGLSFLLDKRSIFKCGCKADPSNLRRRIFQATGKLGPATTAEQRKRIFEKVASTLKTSVGMIEEYLYADLDSELILFNLDPLSSQELLEKYNLSLTQTLLFDSTEMKFTVSANWQKIFFATKRLGLIYDAYVDGGFWVKVDGPSSLFRLTRRYGTAMAKLLPVLVASSEWTVEAKILWKYSNEIFEFKIESCKHRTLFGDQVSLLSYDSVVEADFAARFQALNSKWHLRREPEPVLAGKKVIIPDFSFERESIKLYLEIVGFWTAEYLLRKIDKLKNIDVFMLVAVDETLACERLSNLGKQSNLNVLYYRNKIPLAAVLRFLQDAFKEVYVKQTEYVKNLSVKFTESFVEFEDFARRIGVSAEAVRAALTEETPDNYTVVPNGLIKKEKLEQIRKRIDLPIGLSGGLSLPEAAKITESEGVDLTSAIEALGYKILWHGINIEKAKVIRPQNKND